MSARLAHEPVAVGRERGEEARAAAKVRERGHVVRLHVLARRGALVRAKGGGEGGELRPSLKQLEVACELGKAGEADRRVAAHVAMGQGVPAEARAEQADHNAAEAVVLGLGITRAQERETHDRSDTLLPGLQLEFALNVSMAAHAANKPVILILCNGGMVSFDELIPHASAIIEAFNPVDKGTHSLAAAIFGDANRWGKLSVTIYRKDFTHALDSAGAGIADYSMSKSPGRSYRYFRGEPLYHFGAGLSYTSFTHACKLTTANATLYNFGCTLHNAGSRDGDEVLMLFHALGDDARSAASKLHPVPLKALVGFERVHLSAGASTTVSFALPRSSLAVTRADGSRHVYVGTHSLLFSRDGVGGVAINVTVALQ